ncbi:MAG: toll/interleukin-1 receptor domain-containing protein [Anaerolineae bacterium]|nr:toll/interleukin-1 receptor domain-containing protein [Anaerolineae bacterium]
MRVFVSYATRDNPTAERICQYLSAAGIRCWLDNFEVTPEADWLKEAAAAVRESSHGLFLLSPAAIKSPSAMKEYRSMLALDKPTYVALIEPVERDELPYDLRTAQIYNLVEDFESEMEKLKAGLSEGEGAVATAAPSEARDITITLQANLTDLDTDKFIDLIARLVDAGITDIKVVNVSTG